MRRIWDGVLAVLIAATCGAWIGAAAQWATAACNTADCQDKCKVATEWCYLHNGAPKPVR